MGNSRRIRIVLAAGAVATGLSLPAQSQAAIEYRTFFQDPGANVVPDASLETHAIELIDATTGGERITFAFRDYNRRPIADALIAAKARGVEIDGVVDGGERTRTVVQDLQRALGEDHLVLCGSPDFVFNSCIASSLVPSLQHNKFMTFSRTGDLRDVVLQTSMNFLEPSQFTYYNDMVEASGDRALYDGYVSYLAALKAQVRSDDHYVIVTGDDGRNTMFPSPRRQPDFWTDDTIVDRMNEIDCSGGGRIRVANMAFRSERAVIMRKLIELSRAGCEVEVILTNADGDILAGLVSAGIQAHPFFVRAGGGRQQVIVHSKFWTVDARSTLTGERRKLVYAGSSNWRPDEQYSDDMLLRIADDGVYADYDRYWELIRSRAASVQSRPVNDSVKPSSALTASPDANAAGWNRSDVTLRIAASDGHNVSASGLRRLHVELSGAQTGAWDFAGETDGYNAQELAITAEGETTVTYFAEDARGNVEPAHTFVVRVDRTPPILSGMPVGCELWPPNHQLVHVADIGASDGSLSVSVAGGDARVDDGSVWLRAEKDPEGAARTYTLTATATDQAGNASTATGTCVVPHSQG